MSKEELEFKCFEWPTGKWVVPPDLDRFNTRAEAEARIKEQKEEREMYGEIRIVRCENGEGEWEILPDFETFDTRAEAEAELKIKREEYLIEKRK